MLERCSGLKKRMGSNVQVEGLAFNYQDCPPTVSEERGAHMGTDVGGVGRMCGDNLWGFSFVSVCS